MVTMVGTESRFVDMLNHLLALDYDAVEAYDAAVARLENESYRIKLREFRDDHVRHTQELVPLVASLGESPVTGPGGKQWLAKGKVIVADLVGDKTILVAMKTNEEDTNTAYERACSHAQITADTVAVLERGLADERRHRDWINATLAGAKDVRKTKENA